MIWVWEDKATYAERRWTPAKVQRKRDCAWLYRCIVDINNSGDHDVTPEKIPQAGGSTPPSGWRHRHPFYLKNGMSWRKMLLHKFPFIWIFRSILSINLFRSVTHSTDKKGWCLHLAVMYSPQPMVRTYSAQHGGPKTRYLFLSKALENLKMIVADPVYSKLGHGLAFLLCKHVL